MGSSLKADVKLPMIATKDIAEVAIQYLLNLDFRGNSVKYLLGERDVSYNEVAAIFGKTIGKDDLAYVQFSIEDEKKGMVQSGYLSENVANLMTGFIGALNDGKVQMDVARSSENTTPTTIEEFAHTFKYVFEMN